MKVRLQIINLSANHPAQGPAEAHNVSLSTALTHPSGKYKGATKGQKGRE